MHALDRKSATGAQDWRRIRRGFFMAKKMLPANILQQVLLASSLMLTLNNTATAQTYWLNIPGAYSKVDEQYLPPLSFPTPNHNACSDAVVQYAKDNLVHYIGCDVKPLPDAVNLPRGPLRHWGKQQSPFQP